MLFGGLGAREKSFLFCFLKAHGSMLCTLNPQKKMDLHTAPNLPNKKELLSTPQSFKNKKKNLFPPCKPSKAPKDDVFSQSPYSLRTFLKKGLVLTPNH
jgi:hypothetical protein